MPFKVSRETWLRVEGDRVENFITSIRFWHRVWTDQSLKYELSELGINYSETEILELNDELHRRGIVSEVPGG
jgi:hypothetical protein